MNSKKRKFKRGIDAKYQEDVLQFLNTKVGEEINNNPDLQICIRNNYINVYHKGCSILMYDPTKEDKQYTIHKEYIENSSSNKKGVYEQLGMINGDLIWGSGNSYIEKVLNEPCDKLKKYLTEPGEKSFIASYLKNENPKPFLLDLEVAFTRINQDGNFVADRVDMALINKDMQLQLVEVKIDWNGALKSKEKGKQKILEQMKRYKEFIDEETSQIEKSYKDIAKNYLNLKLSDKFPKLGDMTPQEVLKTFIDSGNLDQTPHLLVIKTNKSLEGKTGVKHWKNLEEEFRGKYILKSWEALENS